MGERFDVLVIGGGMVGLAFGVAAARGGLSVAVVDRERPDTMLAPTFDGRASAIAHASQRALAVVGLWDAVAPHAEPILDIRVSDGESRLFLHYDHRDLGEGPFGHMLENRHLRHGLAQVAPGVAGLTWITGRRVVELARGHAAVARLDDGATLTAAVAVAADGRDSATRQAAGIGVAGWRYRQSGIVCTIAHAEPHRGIAHERFLPPGPFAILPLRGNRSSLVWTEHADLAPAMMALADPDFLAEVGRRFGDFMGDLALEGPRWSYPLALHHAERYVDRRLALIGDAAHGLHPIAGQGLNLGYRDVAALAEVLVDAHRLGLDIGDGAVLERYQRWRRFDNLVLLAVTDGLNRLFANEIGPLVLARRLGLAAVNEIAPLKRLFMRHARGSVGKLPRLLAGEAL